MTAGEWIMAGLAAVCLSVAAVGLGAMIVILIVEYMGRKH